MSLFVPKVSVSLKVNNLAIIFFSIYSYALPNSKFNYYIYESGKV